MPEPADSLPEPVRAWAEEHHEVLELVASEFVRDGAWPTTTELTRRLAREGRPLALESLLRDMPRPLGFVENHPGRIVLLLFGLAGTSSGRSLVDGFYAALQLSLELYRGPAEPPTLTRAELARIPGDEPWLRALSEVVLREAPWLGSGAGGSGDDWYREITPLIVHYWEAQNAADYLQLRGAELGTAPQFGFPPSPAPTASEPAQPVDVADAKRDVLSATRARIRTPSLAP